MPDVVAETRDEVKNPSFSGEFTDDTYEVSIEARNYMSGSPYMGTVMFFDDKKSALEELGRIDKLVYQSPPTRKEEGTEKRLGWKN